MSFFITGLNFICPGFFLKELNHSKWDFLSIEVAIFSLKMKSIYEHGLFLQKKIGLSEAYVRPI